MWRRAGRIDLKSTRLARLPAPHRCRDSHPVVMLEVSQGELESDALSNALFVHYGPPFIVRVEAGSMATTRDI